MVPLLTVLDHWPGRQWRPRYRRCSLSPRLLDALERIGCPVVVANLPRIRLYRNQGLGQNTVREIRQWAERLAEHMAARGAASVHAPRGAGAGRHPSAPEQLSVDRMARLLVPGRLASEDRRILLAYLGLDNGDTAGAWLPQQELSERLAVGRDIVQQALHRARERWSRQPWMVRLASGNCGAHRQGGRGDDHRRAHCGRARRARLGRR